MELRAENYNCVHTTYLWRICVNVEVGDQNVSDGDHEARHGDHERVEELVANLQSTGNS